MDASPATVYGFGSAAIDFRIRTADLGADYTEKLLSRETDVLGGGSAANCLVQIARLGGKASWLGKLGTDWIGDRILSDLAAEGVDCNLVHRDPHHCSPFNVAVYAGSNRRRVGGYLLPNSLAEVQAEDCQGWLEAMNPDDWLLVEVGEIPISAVLDLARGAFRRGARVAVDVDLDPLAQEIASRDEIEKLFAAADLLAPNATAIKTLFGPAAPREQAAFLAGEFDAAVVVTAGAEGAYYCEKAGDVRHHPPIPVEAVDTVGAGDAFHGGLLFELARGATIHKAVATAAACGAAACRAAGARTGMPTQETLPKH